VLQVTLHKKAGPIKPDELENTEHEVCADECSDDELMIPKLDENDEVEHCRYCSCTELSLCK
jgi:hypothetical protein